MVCLYIICGLKYFLFFACHRAIDFPRYKMKCSGGNVILRWIFHACSIMFSSTFHVILWKFGLRFGQCTCSMRSCYRCQKKLTCAQLWALRVWYTVNWGEYVSKSKGVNTIVVYCVSILVYFTLCLRLFNAFWKTVWMRYLENISYPIYTLKR